VFVIFMGVCLAVLVQTTSTLANPKTLRAKAEAFERQCDWEMACVTYAELFKIAPSADVRARQRHCLRRLEQARRHVDPTFREGVLTLKISLALRLYGVILEDLGERALDKSKATPERLFRKGLEELRYALADPTFLREHLSNQKPDTIKKFRNQLHKDWGNLPIPTHAHAVHLVREVAMKTLHELHLNATITVMEFTCGACHGLDDYTTYLTPGQLSEWSNVFKGESVSVGLKLAQRGDKLVIVEVLEDSPAAETMPRLSKNDLVVAIDKKATQGLAAELAMELLEGETNTLVELVVVTPGMPARTVTLRRRPIFVPSVSFQLRSAAVGYVQISYFQESTTQELDAALSALTKAGIKALIVDLRGNAGGLFEAALEVTQRFLANGVIVVKQRWDFKKEEFTAQNPGALTLPLVVMVDGETMSSAEIVAGALKDHKRARLVGQTTFGKGLLQRVFRLPDQGLLKTPAESGGVATGGVRLTVARFFSLSGMAYHDRGVAPHLFVERRALPDSMSIDDTDQQLEVALAEAQRLLDVRR